MEDKLKKEIEKLKDEVKLLKERRINQVQILNEAVKARHIGEGVRFVRSGTASGLPTTGETTLQGAPCYFDETNNKWYIWNPTNEAWVSVTLS